MTRRDWMGWGMGALVATLLLPATARADGVVTRGQFTDRVEHNRPVGDAAALAGARRAVYFIELANPHGEEVHLTIIWRVNGREAARGQIVTRGRATWAFHPIRSSTHEIAVAILDASGQQIHTDQTTITH